ncbi:hypothetical protein N7460_002712 [Penicillium canescens]|uniref:Uncharacterized protein n=1 Tax=Penicillium canescens TaxID=5083 RepID=A0AAD6IKZ6_PENCN|nr:hypothetical protein N7460_002712 [Penicillium canescens]
MRFIWITAALVAGCAGAPLTSPMDPNGDVAPVNNMLTRHYHRYQTVNNVSFVRLPVKDVIELPEDEDTFRPSDRRQGGPCERWRCYQQHLLPSLMLDRSIDRHDEKSETELGLRLDTEATEDDGGW